MVHKHFPYAPCINNENYLMYPPDCLTHPLDYLVHPRFLAHPQISNAPPKKLGGALSNLGGALEIWGALSNFGYLCTVHKHGLCTITYAHIYLFFSTIFHIMNALNDFFFHYQN
jgi:hypothetical protein